jgi:hypothetical protein
VEQLLKAARRRTAPTIGRRMVRMILARVYACRHGMAVVRPDGRRATAEGREKKNGAECGEKNGSHDFSFCFLC